MGSATFEQPEFTGGQVSGDTTIFDGATKIVKIHFDYFRSGGGWVFFTVEKYVPGLITRAVSEKYVGASASFDEFTEYTVNGVAKLKAVGHGSISFKLTVTHDPQDNSTPIQYEDFYYDLFPDSAATYTIDP